MINIIKRSSTDDESQLNVNNAQVILKFFDRKIDLAQISDNR